MSAWNDFVKKIYHEGHNKDKNYSFKQALKDASSRKSEMGVKVTKSKKSKTSKKSRKQRKSKKSKTQRRK